jgi:putative peptidoglycan lipid II flippase
MKLFKAMATVAGLTGLSRIAGFVRDIMTAAILGAGPVADAFFVALKLPNFFRRITAEGAFSVSFVPIYSGELTKEGREEADLFASRTFSLMLWILSAFTALAMIFMPVVINLIAPGFLDDPQRYDLAVELTRITFPYLLLMSLTSLLGGVMNAHDRFLPFALAPVLFNLCMIGTLLVVGAFESAGHALAWGVAISGVAQFILLYISAKYWIGFKVKIVKPVITARIKHLFKLMVPGIIGAGVVQINLFVDMIIGSLLPTGSISYLYYADRLNQLPLSTVGIAVGTALLPMLSRAVASGNVEEAKNLFNRALEITLFLGVPAGLALLVLADPIISILFERGAFTAEDAHKTAQVLQGYALGLPAYIAVKVFSTAFWSRQDTMTPVKISIVVALSNIVLALTLIQFLGVAGIALATGIVGWLHIILLSRPMRGNPAVQFDARFKKAAVSIAVSSCVMAGTVFIVAQVLDGLLHDAHLMIRVIALGGLCGSGMLVYAGMVFATGGLSVSEIKKYLVRKK